MIVWGGLNGVSFTNTGGRYNPSTDSWTAGQLRPRITHPQDDTVSRQSGAALK
jgi:hypothetical protein